MAKVKRADYQLTEKEEKYYKRHKKLIDAMVDAYNLLVNYGSEESNSNDRSAMITLQSALGKEFMQKLVIKRFWDNAEKASKEVAKWPAWKRAGINERPLMDADDYPDLSKQ